MRLVHIYYSKDVNIEIWENQDDVESAEMLDIKGRSKGVFFLCGT